MEFLYNYIPFGIVDNAVMLSGAILGVSYEKYIIPSKWQNGWLGGVIGAGLFNAISDFMGGAISGAWLLAAGTAIGCIIGIILFIPVMMWRSKKSTIETCEGTRRGQETLLYIQKLNKEKEELENKRKEDVR